MSLIWQGVNGVEKLICQGSPSSFPTASFAKRRSARLIPAICFYIGARDTCTLVTFDDACPTSSDIAVLKSSHVLSHVSKAVDLPYSVRISIIYKDRYVDLCSGHL